MGLALWGGLAVAGYFAIRHVVWGRDDRRSSSSADGHVGGAGDGDSGGDGGDGGGD